MPQVDERGHEPVGEHELVAGADTSGPLPRPASYFMAAAFDGGLPRLRQLLGQAAQMTGPATRQGAGHS
ncbi:hypothetical protein ACFY71_37150 [Streptomyces cinerochromogenes]|uniref:hypothetical protein n=1 Tax=Streptomyces cinerochromogenes TaxID=66422 RepID=UPI00369AFDEC